MKRIVLISVSLALLIFSISAFPQSINAVRVRSQVAVQPNLAEITPQVWPGTIVIKFKDGITVPALSNGLVETGIPSIDQKAASVEANSLVKRFRHKPIPEGSGLPDISRIYKLTFPEKFNPIEVAELFKADPNVEYAEPELKMKLLDVPNDSLYPLQQHLPQIMAEQAWNIHKGENGTQEVKIAFIDTGVEWYHEDLWQNVWENLAEDADGDGHTVQMGNSGLILDPGDLNGIDDDGNGFADDLIGWDFYDDYLSGNGSNPDPNAGNSMGFHGTHCAGIATATANNGIGVAGISWNVKYMPLQIDINNDCTWAWDGIIYAADMGADVISNSWGGYYWTYNQYGAEVIAYAKGKGSIVVCAAGNENINGLHMPSSYPGAISVASVNEDDTKTAYSTYGAAVDVSAPGGGLEGGILSTLPGNSYGVEMGTSMATPLVSGLMGLVKSYHPAWTDDQVIAQVIATCDNIDSLNPRYENQLGAGRINAFKALALSGAVPPQELKLELLNYSVLDSDNDGKLDPGDTATISVKLRNYSHCVSTNAVSFNLSSNDGQIDILNSSYTGTIDSDSIFTFEGIFQFKVLPGATSHSTNLVMDITSDIPVISVNDFTIPVVVAPSGFFVFEKGEDEWDYSGSFIRQYLEDLGYTVTYSNNFPQSLMGFDAAFLSMGNLVPPNWEPGTFMTIEMVQVINDYLKTGGKMYIEGGGVFYMPQECGYYNSGFMKFLFGISSISAWTKNPLEKLSGKDGTVCQGMEFTSSSQYNNNYIEKIIPTSSATCPLEENYYGKVAIYNTGTYGQKTFYLAYSLADLKDVDKTSCRYNLLNKVMQTLGYPVQPGWLIANFTADASSAKINTGVAFKDISSAPQGVDVISWQWDFQNDGIIDSYEQNPVYSYSEPGTYDVRLVVSNGANVDEIVQKNFFTAQYGLFVYEGYQGCRDYSGTWMKDFLENNFNVVTYTNEMPRHINGYDALFLSFGTPLTSTKVFEDGFARMIGKYLELGGKVYLEGGFALGLDQANAQVWQMFGLEDVTNPFVTFTMLPFDTLVGVSPSICSGMVFNKTNQIGQFFIDQYFPDNESIVALEQPGYGNVAVQHQGTHGDKTFCFSYALAELADAETTREELMLSVLNYFNLITDSKELIENNDVITINIYPNPFINSTTIKYSLAESSQVSLSVFDSYGRLIAKPVNTFQQKGEQTVEWNMGNLPAGIYFYRLATSNQVHTQKIIKM